MTKIILTFVLYLFSVLAFSQDQNSEIKIEKVEVNITTVVNNVSSNKGKVVFALYKKEGFLVSPITVITSDIIDGKSNAVFNNVPKGMYSIVSFHDKNENNNIDFSTSGMPLEDYGASTNNVSFGPPRFEATKFEVTDKDLTFEIEY